MSLMVILTQLVLPLALLAWLALFHAKGWLSRGLQLAAVGAVLLGLALVALWAMPPFWAPYLYGALYALILLRHVLSKRRSVRHMWRTSRRGTMMILLVAALGLVGVYLTFGAFQGRSLPDEAVVDIAPPFGPGEYLIAHGGSSGLINGHLRTLDPTVERFRPWRGQSKALDIFRVGSFGLHKSGWLPSDPARYSTFGTPILAPCQGQVALVIDGVEDMTVPMMDREHMTGNTVAINCGDFFVILAHFRRDSIVVAEGNTVAVGDHLGEMGNSGNSSEPHLHVHAQRSLPEAEPISGEPLWLTIDGDFLVRNARVVVDEVRIGANKIKGE